MCSTFQVMSIPEFSFPGFEHATGEMSWHGLGFPQNSSLPIEERHLRKKSKKSLFEANNACLQYSASLGSLICPLNAQANAEIPCRRHLASLTYRVRPNRSCHLPLLAAGLSDSFVSVSSGAVSSSTVSWIVDIAASPCSGDDGSDTWGFRRMSALDVFFWRRA